MRKIASDRNYRIIKESHGGDPDRIIQQDIFDMLVADGLSEGLAEIVVSNIARMDMRGMWKKIKAHTEIKKEAKASAQPLGDELITRSIYTQEILPAIQLWVKGQIHVQTGKKA
jgi:hypothetical protein